MGRGFVIGVVTSVLVGLLSGCASLEPHSEPVTSQSFIRYQADTIELLDIARPESPNKSDEVMWNAPQEWLPAGINDQQKPSKGILLVHGLGDSPWSFHDLGATLAEQGFLARSILLPGHGTTPEDMLDVKAEDWQAVVYQQAQALQAAVDGPIYLGGFSTGANLVLEYAIQHPEVAGLALFSPGFKSSVPLQWVTPLLAPLKPWLLDPETRKSLPAPVRYMNMPTNGFAQYHRTSALAQQLLEQPFHRPVLMVVSEHDSVLDTDYLLSTFQTQFPHPSSRLIWYGQLPEGVQQSERMLIKSDYLPEERISQFSHMGVLFAPDNPLYGRTGSVKICRNSQDQVQTSACENGAELWYSAWGYQEEGKVHARLTYNPYFDWQSNVLRSVFTKGE